MIVDNCCLDNGIQGLILNISMGHEWLISESDLQFGGVLTSVILVLVQSPENQEPCVRRYLRTADNTHGNPW